MIAIDRGIPIPPKSLAGGSLGAIYPWRGMKVGDSFFAPDRTTAQLYAAGRRFVEKQGWQIVVRSEPGGVRVWRAR